MHTCCFGGKLDILVLIRPVLHVHGGLGCIKKLLLSSDFLGLQEMKIWRECYLPSEVKSQAEVGAAVCLRSALWRNSDDLSTSGIVMWLIITTDTYRSDV